MKQFPSHFVAHIGPGWSDRKHDVCLIASDSEKFEKVLSGELPIHPGSTTKQYLSKCKIPTGPDVLEAIWVDGFLILINDE